MSEITILQTSIMYFMKDWARCQNVPIPQKEVIKNMEKMGAPSVTALYALHSLITKGYIRKAWTEKQNTTAYILIRNIA